MKVLVTGVKGQLGYDVMTNLQKEATKVSVWMLRRWISQTV